MRTTARLTELGFWLGLVLWVSAIVSAGLAAAFAFPTMLEFKVVVPKFMAYEESEHWSIAAGLLMERIFTFTDMVQLVVCLVTVLSLASGYAVGARRFRQPLEMMRAICIAGAALLLAYRVLLFAPEMNRLLNLFWNAAQDGAEEMASMHRADFQAMHPTASRLYGFTLLLLLVSAAITAWLPPQSTRGPGLAAMLEDPQLLKKPMR